jgi:hypothetical protein
MRPLQKSQKYPIIFSLAIILFAATMVILFRNIEETRILIEQPTDIEVVNRSTVATQIYWKTNPGQIQRLEYKKATETGLYKTAKTAIIDTEIPNEQRIYYTTLTDLEPNTEYLFRIESENKIWDEGYSFKTKPISDEVFLPEITSGKTNKKRLLLITVDGEKYIQDTQYHGTWALDTKGKNYTVQTYADYTRESELKSQLLDIISPPVYAQSGANCQTNIQINVSTTPTKAKVTDVLNRWVQSCPLGGYPEVCYEDVYCRALKYGIDPAFAITIWSNESGGSNYAYVPSVEDFGIHNNSSIPVANFDKQIEHFLKNIAVESYTGNTCVWNPSFGDLYNPSLDTGVIMWGAKFLTGGCTTVDQLRQGYEYMSQINQIYGWYTNKTLTWPFTVTAKPNACSYAGAYTNTTYNSCNSKGTPTTPQPPTPQPPTTRKWLPVTGIGNDGKKISPELDLQCESLGWNTYCTCIWNYNIKPGEYTKNAQIGETCTVGGKVIPTSEPPTPEPPTPEPPTPEPPTPEPKGCCLFNDSVEYTEVKECAGEILENITERYCKENNARINLLRGVNMFEAPLVVNSSQIKIATAKELIQTSNKTILAVGLFRNDQWEKIVKYENGQIYGTDFNFIPGEVYMAITLEDIEIPIKTINIPYDIEISELIGWNLVPTSFFEDTSSTTKNILLNTDYSYIKQVAVWNNQQSLFDYTLRDNSGKIFGDSINISEKIGIFIKIPY